MNSMLKNKMSSFVFHNFSKSSYKLVSKVSGKEEIYYRDDKLVVIIEDETIGKQIYDTIQSLHNWEFKILTNHVELQIVGYVANKENTVQMFFADIHFSFDNGDWEEFTTLEKLQELVSFTEAMQEKGYLLDSDLFDKKNCQNISDFLSFFRPSGEVAEDSNGCIIEYVHYALSHGGDLKEFYAPIVKENQFCALENFPYHIPIIQMCYHYYLNGTIPNSIANVLTIEKLEQYKEQLPNCLLVSNPELSSCIPVTEVTAEYTVYQESIKIYKKDSPFQELFLKKDETFLEECRHQVRETLINVIMDFDGTIIGYQYLTKPLKKEKLILQREFDSQSQIILFVSSLNEFITELIHKNESTDHNKGIYQYLKEDKFNVETDIICSTDGRFKILRIQDLYHFTITSEQTIRKQITMIFFKLLRAYLEKSEGTFSDEKQLMQQKAVRYLSPILAKQFINFALGKKVDIDAAENALITSFSESSDLGAWRYAENQLMYDVNFHYNPSNSVSFLFEYEAESKYGIKLQEGKTVILPDGRRVVVFPEKQWVSPLKRKIDDFMDELKRKIGQINPRTIRLCGISEIIYSSEFEEAKNMYQAIGYITMPIHGVPLTRKLVLGFNNKQILQLAGKLISNFGSYYIDLKHCFIDIDKKTGDFTFYLDILNSEIVPSVSSNEREFVQECFKHLERNGYNPNAFVDINLPNAWNLQAYLLKYASRLDAFCDTHKIYYDSEEGMCPVCLKTQCIIEDNFEQKHEKIFEDSYGTHYRFDSEYNLKIYKPGNISLKQLERNVNNTVIRRIKEKNIGLLQDCFIPYKKALTKKHQFIGYIYPALDFEDVNCNNLKDTEKLINRPRLNSLIRLTQQVQTLILNGYAFDFNPFGDVFLCKDHKKQVQIVNVDLLSTKGSTKWTIEWLYQYVCEVIDADDDIELEISKLKSEHRSIEKLLFILQDFARDLTEFCPTHKLFYNKKELFCPKCFNQSHIKGIEIEYINDSTISKWKYLTVGGEATIYLRKDNSVAKIFKKEEVGDYELKKKVLAAIFKKKKILEQINQESNKFRFIIPTKLLIESETNHILGYVMNEKVEGVAISTLKDTKEVRNLGFTRKDVFEILITVGEGIQTLHDKADIYVGDLNGRNILVDLKKNVYFLDFDGMGIEDIIQPSWTEGYIDPVSQKANHITKKDDWYSFALQAFYYLTFTHPFNGIYMVGGKNMEITDRMEKKLSLLGNHGIEPPSVAQSWDWMNTELIRAFLNIFEGESRESIVPKLKQQYHEKYGGRKYQENDSVIRINAKFLARRNCLLEEKGYDIVRNINSDAAVYSDGEDYHVILTHHEDEYELPFPYCLNIRDILCLENHAIAIYSNSVIAFQLGKEKEVFTTVFQRPETVKMAAVDNTLYLSKYEHGEYIISEIIFKTNAKVKQNKIVFLPEQKTVGFLAQANSKFMLVKRDLNGTDSIYCNSEKLCDIAESSEDSKYHILYDEATKLWVVISNKGNIITINSSDGTRKEVNISIASDEIKVENTAFDKGVLYLPSQSSLYLINVKKEPITIKRMECNKIITPNSRLCNFNPNGFSVISDYVLYDVYKG